MPDPALDDIFKEIEKKHGLRLGPLSEIAEETSWITTGNLGIDYVAGGGLPLGRSVELYGPPSSGKAQPMDSYVLTPDGYVKMGELRVGDAVIDPLGSPSEVTGVFPQGVLPIYRLTFSDGSVCEASGDHLWSVEVYVSGFGYIPATVTTQMLLKRIKQSAGRPRVRLPRMIAPDFRGADMPLDPYLLGLLLGDGGMTGRAILFTTKDAALLQAVRDLSPADCSIAPQSALKPGISWRINGMTKYLRDLGLTGLGSDQKHVPEIYRWQPAACRLALLQGLMDTDGHASSGTYNAGHGTAEFSSVSEQLADDVVWLARSLGLKVVRGKTKQAFYRRLDGEKVQGKDSYRVRIYQTEDTRIFRLPRKIKPLAAGLHTNREIVSVDHVLDAEAQCISVSAPSRMYITDDFIPTHNTTTGLQAAAALQSTMDKGDRILYLDYEKALDPEYCANLGLDVEDTSTFVLGKPYSMEQGAEAALRLVPTNKIRLIIFDSVAAMAPLSRLEGDFGQRTAAMERGRLMSGLLLQLTPLLHRHGTCGLFINHATEKIDMGGRPGLPPKVETPGGVALKFYTSIRLEYRQMGFNKVRTTDLLTQETINQADATQIKVRCTKNKLAKPNREAEVRIRYGAGFDNTWSALEVLRANKRIVKSGAWYYFDAKNGLDHPAMQTSGTGRPCIQGESAVLRFADEHPDWQQRLVDAAVEFIAQAGDAAVLVPDEDAA